ncbi:MAG: hypothetical protein F6K23_08540 [Okeania sp. SIO2C9]|uniref:hypothetical protein n=1 Tax=Okeania sp. SIO2C9 TaxID=2607791 RepID=UPI0013BEED58|nr:hypothetical protein [Okeania sp. SIO2C9]NEQ73119.1 hypothetical protein [Okeania sp. SIO2C9]
MVKEVWGDGDPPAHPSGGGECEEMGSVGKIKKYISSPLPCRTNKILLFNPLVLRIGNYIMSGSIDIV